MMRFVAKDGTALPDKNKEKGEASCRSASQSIAVMKEGPGFQKFNSAHFQKGACDVMSAEGHACVLGCLPRNN